MNTGLKESAVLEASLCGAQMKGKGEGEGPHAWRRDPRTDAVPLSHQQQEQAVESVGAEGRDDLSTIKTQERGGTGHVFRVGLPGGAKMKSRIWGAGKTQRTETKGRRRNVKELTLPIGPPRQHLSRASVSMASEDLHFCRIQA